MQYCHLTDSYVDKDHRIPAEALVEANWKLQEFIQNNTIGSFLYAESLKEELKRKYKYKCQNSSGSRAGD